MNKPQILFFDIETSPCMAWVWSTGKQYVTPEQILEPTRIICISYKWEGEKKVHNLHWSSKQDDGQMLKQFTTIAEKADAIIGHNGKAFDVKHINARIAYHSLPPLAITMVEDTLLMSRKAFRLPSHKLDYLAKYFKVGGKMSTGGIKLWLDIWLDKCPKALKKMIRYCNNDVTLLEKVYLRLKPYLQIRINISAHAVDSALCPSCGHKLQKHGTRFTSALRKVQRYRCMGCFKTCSGGKNLLVKPTNYPR